MGLDDFILFRHKPQRPVDSLFVGFHLKNTPDLFVFDGQGLAHPRAMGLATHMGIILGMPSIGSAKSHLYGLYSAPGAKKGNFSIMEDTNGRPIGSALRTRDNTKPIFVSPGHLTQILQ